MSRWSVDMTLRYEYPQEGGTGGAEIRIMEGVDGVSPANDDALWAAQEVLINTVKRFGLEAKDVQVIKLDVMDMDERG